MLINGSAGSWAGFAKSLTGQTLSGLVGRKNLARAARFLTNAARLDGENDMLRNGETLVQDTVIRHFPADRLLIAVDAGANTGRWTLQFTSRARGRNFAVHAFEPVTSTARMFRANVSDPAVTLVTKALSDHAGTAEIAVHEEGDGINALVPDTAVPVKYREKIVLTTVDDYCREVGIDDVALLKIDAEGHDLFVLRGGTRMFSTKRIAVAQFEYNHRWIWSRAFLRDVFEFAAPWGYRLGKVTRRGVEFYTRWDKELEKFQEGNYLLCREDWFGRFPQVRWWAE